MKFCIRCSAVGYEDKVLFCSDCTDHDRDRDTIVRLEKENEVLNRDFVYYSRQCAELEVELAATRLKFTAIRLQYENLFEETQNKSWKKVWRKK